MGLHCILKHVVLSVQDHVLHCHSPKAQPPYHLYRAPSELCMLPLEELPQSYHMTY